MNTEIDKSFIDIKQKNNEKVKELFSSVGINSTDKDGRTLLHNTSCYNNVELFFWALQNGVDVNCKDNDGWSALHFAVRENNLAATEALLKNENIIVDIEDNYGNSALWRGVMENVDVQIIELLIQNGADPEKNNFHDVAPIDLVSDENENAIFVMNLITKIIGN